RDVRSISYGYSKSAMAPSRLYFTDTYDARFVNPSLSLSPRTEHLHSYRSLPRDKSTAQPRPPMTKWSTLPSTPVSTDPLPSVAAASSVPHTVQYAVASASVPSKDRSIKPSQADPTPGSSPIGRVVSQRKGIQEGDAPLRSLHTNTAIPNTD